MPYLLHHLLEASARRHPDRPAVFDGDRSLSYGGLEREANRLAHLLVDGGVRPGDRVALYLDKSIEALVAIYGTLKAGAVYVPLDRDAPAARLGTIARDAGTRWLLAGSATHPAVGQLIAAGAPLQTVVVLDARQRPRTGDANVRLLTARDLIAQPSTPPATTTIDLDLAYLLYTSGSTGVPKGVMLSHRNALAFVEWAAERMALAPADRLSSHAPLHFDLSIFDLFAAALAGAAVVLVPQETSAFPREVAKLIERREITVWYSVPSLLSMLALRGGLRPGALPRLRLVLFAGEVFPVRYLRRLMAQLPHVAFYNLYGPTETNVCTYYEVPRLDEERTKPIPIGRAIDDVELLVVDDDGRPVTRGEAGELWVRGATVMRGYWSDPQRSARCLVADPLGRGAGDAAYRTGDIVREDAGGDLEFLGRRDAQIKSRGFRIELGDVEAALYAHPAVVECAVEAVPDELVTNRIKAYVVLSDGSSEAELRRFCEERIPAYMAPEILDVRHRLPKTSTGKIDRRALQGAAP